MMEISYISCDPEIQASHFSLLSTCEVLGKLLIQPFISMYADSYGYSNAFVLFSLLYFVCVFNFAFYKPIKRSSPSKSDSAVDKSN
jgi:dipeptide/tripeptide permease